MWLCVSFTLIASLLLHEELSLCIQQEVGWEREYKQPSPRIELSHYTNRGTRWRSKLKHCPTNRKIAGSITDRVTRIFHWIHPTGCTMCPRSTQPLAEMGASDIFWGHKGGRWTGLTTLLPNCADCVKHWAPQPHEALRVSFTLFLQ
jgi:hypothetical protein